MDLSSVDPGWSRALHPLGAQLDAVQAFLDAETVAGHDWLPEPDAVLRAFEAPLDDVRVLIVGQDPYPTPGHAVGLAFSADRAVRPLPRSLANIYKELHDDLGIPPAAHPDLSAWQRQGVLLLNRVLTVQSGETGSHRRHGWEEVTAHAIRVLAARPQPLVAVLWGKDAASVAPLLGDTPAIVSAHPSPLSARRGFFGSKPFSRVNAALQAQGAEPIDWRIDASPAP
ncbi:uracil-DNA glycosylase [Salinibacterium amurskyense]|uniref:Uracil-DNA glycosylase n=1 Tax=Salinibacterium amurskyense TaxID=205941 RepID=A0A2M9D1Y5_9MICO|nr:uracil-DNA glycosylase [Salinibacterium amurskyense]PJJ78018.1 uracil-DNA glycosylase [Salinibacterium amurskyense]RLQ80176.1 uracil-DNA glycosylase [Salinibacterium amurskyense]